MFDRARRSGLIECLGETVMSTTQSLFDFFDQDQAGQTKKQQIIAGTAPDSIDCFQELSRFFAAARSGVTQIIPPYKFPFTVPQEQHVGTLNALQGYRLIADGSYLLCNNHFLAPIPVYYCGCLTFSRCRG